VRRHRAARRVPGIGPPCGRPALPRRRGLLQTGQRIGASIGIAAAGAAFFTTLRGHGSFAHAYQSGIVVSSAITAAALLLALIDRRRATTGRIQRPGDRHPTKAPGSAFGA
jgi:hypothetical protein